LHHHDPETLLAGKLGAVLQRAYVKGRDIYDLWWYLNQSNWPEPNLSYLNQSLAQGGWTGEALTVDNWRTIVHQKIQTLDWPLVLEDVNKEQLLEVLG